MLTRERKQQIIDYVFDGDNFFKGMMEGTSLGESYGEPDGVTEEEFHDFIREIKKREEAYQGLLQRKLLLNFDEPHHVALKGGKDLYVESAKIIENGAGYGKHLIFSVTHRGVMTEIEPPLEASIWLGKNMRSIVEIQE